MSFGQYPALQNVVVNLLMNQVEFFLTNPEFVRWVRQPDRELDTYWKNWIDANPEKIEALKSGREIIKGIQFKEIFPTTEIRNEVLTKILQESKMLEKKVSKNSQMKQSLIDWINGLGQFYKVAAIIVIASMFHL